jgi:hypothetical protein
MGDRVQLQQVILNLIMSGIEAMSAVMRQPRVLRVRSQIDGPGDLLIAVEDSGPGLATETMDRLFDSFFTTKPSGMGVGLSSVGRSSRPMAVASGRRRGLPAAPSFNSPCRPRSKGHPDRSAANGVPGPQGTDFGEHFQLRGHRHASERLDEVGRGGMGPADESPMTEIFDERPAALDVGRHAGNDDEELAYLGSIRISQHRRARMRRFPELAVFGVILRKNLPYARADLRTRR